MTVETGLNKVLGEELRNANSMMAKYETKILDGGGSVDDVAYMKERLAYWSGVATAARSRLFETKTEPSG